MIHIRTFFCHVCRTEHDEACPPRRCGARDLVPAAAYGLPPQFVNQHGIGLVSYEDVAHQRADREVA